MGARLAMSASKDASMRSGPCSSRAGFTIGVSPASGWRQQPVRKWGARSALSIGAGDGTDRGFAFAFAADAAASPLM